MEDIALQNAEKDNQERSDQHSNNNDKIRWETNRRIGNRRTNYQMRTHTGKT
jgi:hypothetical protein